MAAADMANCRHGTAAGLQGEATVRIGEILRNNVKEKLARDVVVASMTVRLVRSAEIARIAHTAGFDTFYVDMQH
jgi:4-hydroxy-2-oxoheptanedioate aldolase